MSLYPCTSPSLNTFRVCNLWVCWTLKVSDSFFFPWFQWSLLTLNISTHTHDSESCFNITHFAIWNSLPKHQKLLRLVILLLESESRAVLPYEFCLYLRTEGHKRAYARESNGHYSGEEEEISAFLWGKVVAEFSVGSTVLCHPAVLVSVWHWKNLCSR